MTEIEKNLWLIIQDILVPKYYRRERQVRVVTLIKMFKYGAVDDDDDDNDNSDDEEDGGSQEFKSGKIH